MTADQIENEDTIFVHETEAIESLRHRGFAVIVWSPGEMAGANSRRVEERSVEIGWDIIEGLRELDAE